MSTLLWPPFDGGAENASPVQTALSSGAVTFYGHEILVERGVLVPRVETEVLVSSAEGMFDRDADIVAIDVGCGAGNVSVALAHSFPRARVYATDLAPRCVELATRNVHKHELDERVTVHEGDLFHALDGIDLEGRVALIVSSPPFISSGRLERDRKSLLDLEPREAFDAGPYGIAFHLRLTKEAIPFLTPGTGALVLEFGQGQSNQVRRLFERSGAYEEPRLVVGSRGHAAAAQRRR